MKYCKKCILPDTRPMMIIGDDKICLACKTHQENKKINWIKREKLFSNLFNKIKKKSKYFDVLIPVSGCKDSTWQVLKCLEHNLKPLTYTYRPIERTKIGQINIDNLKGLGVDHIEYSVNPKIEKELIKRSFLKFGSMAISMHLMIWNGAMNLSNFYKIPYIIWGENSAVQYSGITDKYKTLNKKWIKKYGNTFGKSSYFWVKNNFSQKDLSLYHLVKTKFKPKSIFLSDYFRWDPKKTFAISKKYGFKNLNKPLTGIYNFSDIDDSILSIHHYLKYYKFGITRVFDNLSLEIRNGRISRDEAVKIANKSMKIVPHGHIKRFCNFINISEKKFFQVCEKFRNKKIWKKKKKKWVLENPLS